jgi:RNA polymerase sigma-B factor
MAPQPCDTLVLEHRRLARHLAQRYVRDDQQREDLEQVAYLGLVKAAQRFDPERGVAFTTFAVPTILGELRRFCRDTRWAVHVPRATQERVQALRRFEDRHGRVPTAAEAADALGWPLDDVIETRLASGCLSQQSLNVRVRSDDGTLGEAIENVGDEDAAFADVERRDELRQALARLTERERRALRLRGEAGCSTPEIARRMRLSTPQAARLVARALPRLRAALDGDPLDTAPAGPRFVRLAEADPDLFARAPESARAAAVAERLPAAVGRWRGPRGEGLGLLVLCGALLRTITVEGRRHAELIGPSDVIRRADGDHDAVWRVIEPAGLAILPDTLCRWPAVVDALRRRASDRSDALALQLALTDLRRADDRVLNFFRALADRWGQRVDGGVEITVPLTHDMIAVLVGVHRPSVTSALRRLEGDGLLRRSRRDRWLLGVDEPAALAA